MPELFEELVQRWESCLECSRKPSARALRRAGQRVLVSYRQDVQRSCQYVSKLIQCRSGLDIPDMCREALEQPRKRSARALQDTGAKVLFKLEQSREGMPELSEECEYSGRTGQHSARSSHWHQYLIQWRCGLDIPDV
jgi:hypothetical protein